MTLVEACYHITATLPADEQYGLSSQIRRAAVSIPANLAEGHGRRTRNTYRHHVAIALGSHAELETCLELTQRLGYLTAESMSEAQRLSQAVGAMLYRLHQSLDARSL